MFEFLVLILREVIRDHIVPQRVRARSQRLRARQQLDHGGLARAVHAHQRHAVAALDDEAGVAENELLAVALRYIFEFRDNPPAGLGLRELEVDGLLVGRNLDALNLVQLFDARLHLLGLGRLRAKAVDEGLQLLDALALIAVGRRQLIAALGLLAQIRIIVVAAVELHALVPDLDRPVDRHVQEVAVVRDQQVRARIVRQIRFQPVAGFEIQVVGGLIEQQQARLFEQQLRQRQAHLPAARKFLGAPLPVFLAEPQPVEHRADLRLDRVAIAIRNSLSM